MTLSTLDPLDMQRAKPKRAKEDLKSELDKSQAGYKLCLTRLQFFANTIYSIFLAKYEC